MLYNAPTHYCKISGCGAIHSVQSDKDKRKRNLRLNAGARSGLKKINDSKSTVCPQGRGGDRLLGTAPQDSSGCIIVERTRVHRAE